MADVYFAYGKALLENAITQTSVLGKDQTEEAISGKDKGGTGASFPLFSHHFDSPGFRYLQSQRLVPVAHFCHSQET